MPVIDFHANDKNLACSAKFTFFPPRGPQLCHISTQLQAKLLQFSLTNVIIGTACSRTSFWEIIVSLSLLKLLSPSFCLQIAPLGVIEQYYILFLFPLLFFFSVTMYSESEKKNCNYKNCLCLQINFCMS